MSSSKKSWVQTLGLLLLLVVLPAGSWYYLQKGLNYQKNARAELLDYGQLDTTLTFLSTDGQKISVDALRGKLSIFSFVDNTSLDDDRIQKWNGLLEQFEETGKVAFVMTALDTLTDFEQYKNLPTSPLCYYLNPDAVAVLKKTFEIPKISQPRTESGKYATQAWTKENDYPYYVLLDSTLTIRNYYQVGDMGEIRRMVEQMAMIVPREKPKKPQLLREKEK